MKTELTVSESQHLVDLGVDPKLASKEVALTVYEAEYNDPLHPVFRLADVIEALPKEIGNYELNISATKNEYFVSYILWDSGTDDYGYIRDVLQGDQISAPELIDSLYLLLCWYITEFKKKEK